MTTDDLGASASRARFVDPAPPSHLELHAGVRLCPRTDPPSRPHWDGWRPDLSANPRAALERVVREILEAGPAVVQFSGGRDSSLVLAVAVHVARRDGLPIPEAVSMRYQGEQATEESSWQELVTDHLKIPLRVLEVQPGGNELTGDLGVSALRRYGPVLPPPCAIGAMRMGPVTVGRSVMTGEGGDSVLGAVKISYWAASVRRRRVPSGPLRRLMMEDLPPLHLRRRLIRRRLAASPLTWWLRPDPQHEVLESLAAEFAAVPWDWRDATWSFLEQKICAGYATMRAVAASEGFALCHPLLDVRFVEALCRRAGALGFPHRTAVMRVLAGDLLPDAVLSRTTKAGFNGVYAGRGVRAFAEAWNGEGVDDRLVDVTALRQAWSSPLVPALSLAPLQLALRARLRRDVDTGGIW